MTRLRALRDDLRAMGSIGWLLYVADRLLTRASRGRAHLWCFLFYVQPVSQRAVLPPASNAAFRVARIESGEIETAAFQRPPGAIKERFASGSICIAARKADKLQGFMWLHFGVLKERLVACDFEALPGETTCWDYDFEIFPEHRLGRTFVRLWDEAHRILRERGITSTVSWISYANLASRRSHERMGARRHGWLIVLDVFDRKLAISPSSPHVRIAGAERRLYCPVRVP